MENKIDRAQLNEISMQVILHAGNARDFTMQVLTELAKDDVDSAHIQKLLGEAHKELAIAHNRQTEMIQKEANDETIPFSVLFIHSQDTLMTIQSELLLVEKLIPVLKK